MKIYTKAGDRGTTSLFNGEKLAKSNPRIEAYGTVDELNSFVALLKDHLADHQEFDKFIQSQLRDIQVNLFNIGGELANPANNGTKVPDYYIKSEDITQLEESIDSMSIELPKLTRFVLPGGTKVNSIAHICRTITRRAERRVTSLSLEASGSMRPEIIQYLNRLSDWFFVLSRFLCLKLDIEENFWEAK